MKTKNRLLMISSLLTLSAIACSKTADQTADQNTTAAPETSTTVSSSATNNSGVAKTDSTGKPTEAAMHETPELTSSELLARIHQANTEEERMGKLAQERGSSKYVKEYGKTLRTDHTEADKKITALAKEKNIDLVQPTAKSEAEAAAMKKHQDLMVRLNGLKGKDFDKAFLEGMKIGHQDNIHMLETVQVEDAEVKSLVSDLLPTLRKHYRMSVDIVQDLAL